MRFFHTFLTGESIPFNPGFPLSSHTEVALRPNRDDCHESGNVRVPPHSGGNETESSPSRKLVASAFCVFSIQYMGIYGYPRVALARAGGFAGRHRRPTASPSTVIPVPQLTRDYLSRPWGKVITVQETGRHRHAAAAEKHRSDTMAQDSISLSRLQAHPPRAPAPFHSLYARLALRAMGLVLLQDWDPPRRGRRPR
jgi:hypothetical protein